MKRFEKESPQTEGSKFYAKFKGKKFLLGCDALGNITRVETDDKEIIEWLKDKGLTQR